MVRVLILDGHCSAALAFVRSLGRAGYWVAVGYSEGSFAPAAVSRYCHLQWKYPSPTDGSARFLESLLAFIRQHGIVLVVPMTDATIWPLSVHREQFNGLAHLVIPSHKALGVVSDKYRTITFAKSLGVPVPETVLVRSIEDLYSVSEWSLPIVVKDLYSVRWVNDRAVSGGVAYAYSRDDLINKVDQRLKKVSEVLVQKFFPGIGIGFSCLVISQNIYLPFQWERIREKDPRGSGSSARRSTGLDPQILEYSQCLIKRTGYQGVSMVEFKENNGQFVLMEINGRPWGSIQLPIHCGVNYPIYLIDWYLNGKLPCEQIEYKKGITCRWLTADLLHLENLLEGPPAGWPVPYPNFWISLLKIIIPWYPGLRYDDISFNDLRPGFASLSMWFKNKFRVNH